MQNANESGPLSQNMDESPLKPKTQQRHGLKARFDAPTEEFQDASMPLNYFEEYNLSEMMQNANESSPLHQKMDELLTQSRIQQLHGLEARFDALTKELQDTAMALKYIEEYNLDDCRLVLEYNNLVSKKNKIMADRQNRMLQLNKDASSQLQVYRLEEKIELTTKAIEDLTSCRSSFQELMSNPAIKNAKKERMDQINASRDRVKTALQCLNQDSVLTSVKTHNPLTNFIRLAENALWEFNFQSMSDVTSQEQRLMCFLII